MSRPRTRVGLLFGLFLCAAMHATSVMANSGWCPASEQPDYAQDQVYCQDTITPDYAAEYPSLFITAPCHVTKVGWVNSAHTLITGEWVITIYNPENGGASADYGGSWFCPPPRTPSPAKALGNPNKCNCAADPIDVGTGNVFRREEDFHAGHWLTFDRYYNSDPNAGVDTFGQHWRHSYSNRITYTPGTTGTGTATVTREDGRVSTYALSSGAWAGEPDVFDALSEQTDTNGNPTGWTLLRVDTRSTEQYDATGHLLSIQYQDGFTTTLTYSTATTPITIAPGVGYLITITDASQRTIQLTYTSSGLINHVTAPDGGSYSYGYNGAGDLATVTYPDTSVLTYLYNESGYSGGATTPGLLTGIIDESNVRYMSYSYNAAGQAINNQLAGGVGSYTMTYNSDGSADVLDPLGTSRHHAFTTIMGVPDITSVNGTCEACAPISAWAYDFNGLVNQTTDYNGNVTTYQHDGDGMEAGSVEASTSTTPRPIQTDWNDTFHVPTERRWLDYSYNIVTKTDWIYNARGQALAQCTIDMSVSAAASYTCSASGTPPAGVRRWTYTYCDTVGTGCPQVGLRLTTTGPRTDLTQTTTYSYYTSSSATNCGTPGGACHQPGDLYQVTDALGHVTTYASYDGDGRVTRITDANGVNTDMTYTPRGWLASRSVGGSTTSLTYWPYGEVKTLTDPDNVTTTFVYDGAHRLTDIYDAQSNDLHYTLNAAGQKTGEQVITASGTTVQSKTSNFNPLGQLTAVIDGLGKTVFSATFGDSYDGNGNLTHSADGLTFQRQQNFDALNRLYSTVANYNGTDTATNNTTTSVIRDAQDHLTQVTDPRTYNTVYTYDGLGNVTTLQSPDTGTSSSTFDAAGNTVTHTDAKGTVGTSTYDALDRLTGTSYPSTVNNVTYTYDESNAVTGCSASSPIGRRTRMLESSVTTTYCYDARGNVIQKTQGVAGFTDVIHYGYTAADRLNSETTPDQTAISYTFNSNGRISGVQVTPSGSTSSPPTVVSNVVWMPFGPVASYTLGNGQAVTRTYDANYRLTDLTTPTAFNLHFARDVMGDISARGAAPGANPAAETYQYDPLYRLTSVTESGTVLESYTYNRVGDRLSKTATGPDVDVGTYSYTAGTHQLSSIGNATRAYDANGNTTGSVVGGQTYGFAYNARQRPTLAQANGVTVGTYIYNALGQRVDSAAATTERFDYDEAGHLLGTYGVGPKRIYVWLDDLPIALVDNTVNGSVTTSTVNYVIADQLGTPRAVTNGAGTVLWGWGYQGNPFGEQQPTSSTGYVLNLRYPGQYYDAETETVYNGFRNYEPGLGRYLQSDPIGLAGGISTYAYVGDDPLSHVDPYGMQEVDPAEISVPERDALRDTFAPLEGPNMDVSQEVLARKYAMQGGECYAPGKAPDFVVTPDGTVYPVPRGASGPDPANSGKGMQFQGGSGGNGLDPKTSGFRFMDPVTSGNYQYPNGYGSYNNANGQTVNPYTGSPNISKTDPLWHIPPGG
ncbi:RHS repeat-associated core domain-containing protein [Dyella sp. S184]|uniref:RHS repeat-associated core domain-containing protein n=1 Tax=Dyella sp. S184 TaxID=1641862 RepID=UPI00131CE47F|nr:RHS repeat-associated core domain-containing protein [Dyella sp. S184]